MNARQEDDFNRTLGLRLMVMRQSKKLSQEYLGGCIGVSGQQLAKYENGINRITPKRLAQCAAVLGVPVGYFYGEEEGGLPPCAKGVLSTAADLEHLPEDIRRVVHHLVRVIAKTWRERSNDNQRL